MIFTSPGFLNARIEGFLGQKIGKDIFFDGYASLDF